MDQDELLRSLTALLNAGRWEDAYIWFREHQNAFTQRERRLLRAMLLRRLWRGPALLVVATMAIQILTGGTFTNQLQDFFSFLGRSFRPYMYVARAAPLVVNVVLAAVLAFQCYERLVFTSRMLGRRPPWTKVAGAWLLAAVFGGVVDSVAGTLCQGPAAGAGWGMVHRQYFPGTGRGNGKK